MSAALTENPTIAPMPFHHWAAWAGWAAPPPLEPRSSSCASHATASCQAFTLYTTEMPAGAMCRKHQASADTPEAARVTMQSVRKCLAHAPADVAAVPLHSEHAPHPISASTSKSWLCELTPAMLGACGGGTCTGGGAGTLQSGQYIMASNCVSASQRTRLSRESGPLKSDSHSGKGAPKGSSCGRQRMYSVSKRSDHRAMSSQGLLQDSSQLKSDAHNSEGACQIGRPANIS